MINHGPQYKKYIESEERASKSTLEPRNIYRISSYEYSDEDSQRSLAGINSSLVFVVGIHEKKLICLKLNDIKPEKFMKWLPTVFKPALKSEHIDNMEMLEEIIIQSDRNGSKIFESKIKTNIIYTTEPRPYRSYYIEGLKFIQLVNLKKDFLKSLL